MIEMRMADKDVINTRKFVERQILHARSSVNEHVVIQKERGGPEARATDPA
jgi:hypothetical protein